MQTTADRITQRMAELGISQSDIVRKIGAGRATISSWVAGKTEPSAKYLPKLAEALKCNSDWLVSGQSTQNHLNNNGGYIGGSVNQSVVNHYANCPPTDSLDRVLTIPFYPTANFATPKQDLYLTWQLLPTASKDLVATIAFDDAMSPTVREKSLIVADTALAGGLVYHGKLYLLDMGGLLMCRYLEQVAGGKIRVFSGKDSEGQTVSREQFDVDYRIVGGVVWLSSFIGW